MARINFRRQLAGELNIRCANRCARWDRRRRGESHLVACDVTNCDDVTTTTGPVRTRVICNRQTVDNCTIAAGPNWITRHLLHSPPHPSSARGNDADGGIVGTSSRGYPASRQRRIDRFCPLFQELGGSASPFRPEPIVLRENDWRGGVASVGPELGAVHFQPAPVTKAPSGGGIGVIFVNRNGVDR